MAGRFVGNKPLQITSLDNPRIEQALKLRRRAQRNRQGKMLVEGVRELSLALDMGYRPETVFLCPEIENSAAIELHRRCDAAGVPVATCSSRVMDKLSYRESTDGCVAVGPPLGRQLGDLDLPPDPLVVVVEAVEKPGNLGAILRTADAVGVDALLVCDRCTDIGNPNVIRASLGAVFSVPVVEVGGEDAVAWLDAHGIPVYATTPGAENSYTQCDFRQGLAIAMGAEHEGLSELWLSAAQHRVHIPMLGRVDSLNVSVSTAILLYEVRRQRGTSAS